MVRRNIQGKAEKCTVGDEETYNEGLDRERLTEREDTQIRGKRGERTIKGGTALLDFRKRGNWYTRTLGKLDISTQGHWDKKFKNWQWKKKKYKRSMYILEFQGP